MLIANPKMLAEVEPEDFCDEELRLLVHELKNNKKLEERKGVVARTLKRFCITWLPSANNKKQSAKLAILNRLKLDSKFNEGLAFLQNAIELARNADNPEHDTDSIKASFVKELEHVINPA